MPTPAHNDQVHATPSTHSCPDDEGRLSWTVVETEDPNHQRNNATQDIIQQPTPPPQEAQTGPAETYTSLQAQRKRPDIEEDNAAADMLSPMSVEGDKQDYREVSVLANPNLGSPSMSHEFSNVRLIPTTPSSYLRPGSRFHGTQKSERQIYEVQVEIKHVDMRESFLCGYLRIKGLTEDHPTLTTYFEGEIIGSKYTFLTQHQDWGSTDKVDLQHWNKFEAFKPLKAKAKRGLHIPHVAQRENIFMRWKEHFLVPDHRVRTLSGASFEGFYYICFNQLEGKVDGIYFHAKSEKFQTLTLYHVEDRGCYSALEFR